MHFFRKCIFLPKKAPASKKAPAKKAEPKEASPEPSPEASPEPSPPKAAPAKKAASPKKVITIKNVCTSVHFWVFGALWCPETLKWAYLGNQLSLRDEPKNTFYRRR